MLIETSGFCPATLDEIKEFEQESYTQKMKTQNIKEAQLFNKIEELIEANQNLKINVSESEKILDDKDNILELLSKNTLNTTIFN